MMTMELVMMLMAELVMCMVMILLMLTGIKHPPTANDREKLGIGRHILGWLTLSFLLVGLTLNPITVPELEDENRSAESVQVVAE
jgi:hypothetical protein